MTQYKKPIFALIVAVFFTFWGTAFAANPTLTLTANNNGDTVQLNINGDPNSAVVFNYTKTGIGAQLAGIGSTNTSGALSTTISSSAYGISAGSQVYVTVAGQQSAAAAWPSVTGSSSFSLSQSSATLTIGQSVNITAYNAGTLYVSANSNPPIANTNINGNQVTVTGLSNGSTTITLCSQGNTTSCATVLATVQNSSAQSLVFNANNLTITPGQSITVTAFGGTGNYIVSSNSNSGAVQSTISGSNITLTAGSSGGVSAITVCSSDMSSCGTINATAGTSSSSALTFNPASPSVPVGQTLTVSISGYAATSYYISSNSNSSVLQASTNSNILTLTGLASGSSVITVCANSTTCSSLTVIVGAGTSGISFSQSTISLNVGSNMTFTINGSGGYYVASHSNSNTTSVQVSGSTGTVTALANGTDTISICQTGGNVFVTVGNGTSDSTQLSFTPQNPTIAVGQTTTVTISGGGSAVYYVSSNSSPSLTTLALNGSLLSITGQAVGTSTIVICSTSNSCGNLLVSVGTTSTTNVLSPYFLTASLTPAITGQYYSSQLSAAGGSGVYTFAVASGSLPAGLTLSSAGLVSGTPTTDGTQNFSVIAADSANHSTTGSFSLTVSPASLIAPTTPAPVTTTTGSYANGQLILENGTISIVYQNTKVGFTNGAAFTGLGFKYANVTTVTNSGLTVSPKTVVTAVGSHPRGTWVISGQTIYFVTPSGLIPVPTWDIFTSAGGQASFIVPANKYDLGMKKLSPMTSGDSRLHN